MGFEAFSSLVPYPYFPCSNPKVNYPCQILKEFRNSKKDFNFNFNFIVIAIAKVVKVSLAIKLSIAFVKAEWFMPELITELSQVSNQSYATRIHSLLSILLEFRCPF